MYTCIAKMTCKEVAIAIASECLMIINKTSFAELITNYAVIMYTSNHMLYTLDFIGKYNSI